MRRFLLVSLTSLVACGDPTVVFPEVLQAVIAPSHGSVDVAPDVELVVAFSHELDDGEPLAPFFALQCLGAPPCSAPDASACATTDLDIDVTYDASSQVASLEPASALASAMCHVIIVSAGVPAKSSEVRPLPTDLRAVFSTR